MAHRYKVIETEKLSLVLRDDGCRISFLVLNDDIRAGNEELHKAGWIMWAEYKQCDLPGPTGVIADHFMLEKE